MEKTLTIAGVQLIPTEDREKNIEKASRLMTLAADEGAKVVVLPEMFSTPWFPSTIDESKRELAEPEDGRTVTAVREAADRKDLVVVANVYEADGEDLFNTAFVIGPSGEIIGKYRKVHVPQIPLWEEKAYFKPGDTGFPVFETPYATLGVQVCWDAFFPEGFRILALKGAELICVPTACAYYHSRKKWERALSASAHANGVFVMRVNRTGREERQEFYGRSFCVGPDGEFVGEPSGPSEGVILAELDMRDIPAARNEWMFLKDRRPEHYREILESE